MAAVGSSLTQGMNVTIEEYTDITSTGVLNLPNRRFTTANNLITGRHYRFKIKAYNGVMEGGYSPKSARIITALVPSAPQNLEKLFSSKTSIQI